MMTSMERWAPDGGAGWAEYGSFLRIFICFPVAVLRFIAARAFSSCGEQGPPFDAVHRLLTAVGSLLAEHASRVCGFQ